MRIVLLFAAAFTLSGGPISRNLFRSDGVLTEPSAGDAKEIAASFTRAQVPGAPGVYLHKEYRTEHNGVTHFVYRQRYQGLDIATVEWVVNVDRDGAILNAGGTLYQSPTISAAVDRTRILSAARAAAAAVNPVLAAGASVTQSGFNRNMDLRFSTNGAMGDISGRAVWFPTERELRPAFEFVVFDADQISAYLTIIDAESETVLSKSSLTFSQQGPRGLVFTGISPQPPARLGMASTEPPPYVDRVLTSFPAAWITGTETAGNNTVTGLGLTADLLSRPQTATAVNSDFQFPLLLGANAPHPSNYGSAAVTNLFYWVNRAHDLFYSVGFDEQAGNYQARNFGRGGLEGDAFSAFAHYGTQAPNGFATLNNAFYTTTGPNDGDPAFIAMFLTQNGGEWADGSLANDVILHEYTHGVTRRLVRNIGGHQGGAINEALSDFWALEWLLPEGAPVDGVYPVGEYWSRSFGRGIRTRPVSTNMEINPLTFADLGRVWGIPVIHEDGQIWVAALWDARANLIRQFGEREGRRRIRQIVLDAMKLARPAPSMVDMRDAVLLADRVDFKGESQSQLWDAFARRGLGALAYTANASTIYATASFEKPSTTGAIGVLAEPFAGEAVRIFVNDTNNSADSITVDVTASSGDAENIVLTRQSGLFTGTVPVSGFGTPRKGDRLLTTITGDSMTVYYNDANANGAFRQIERTIPIPRNYGQTFNSPIQTLAFPNERLLSRRNAGSGNFDRVTLPFEFPFYGKTHREVRVFAEGYLQFDTALQLSCVDGANLNGVSAIAPMGTWMRTNGLGQPNEGVYMSTGPNTVTFRWAGETVATVSLPPLTPAPAIVNFAVTLHENGRIQFFYGSGNTSVVNDSPFCATTAPFVGISRGTGTGVISHTFGSDRGQFQNAPVLEFIPPFGHATVPVVKLDSPAPDSEVRGVLTVRGITYDEDTLVTSAAILIDGVLEGTTGVTLLRPDACAGQRIPGCPFVGFQRAVNLAASGIRPGRHTLQLRVANAKGGFTDYPEQPLSFTVVAGEGPLPAAVLETPEDLSAPWTGNVTLRGHAYGPTTRVASVDVLIDGIAYTRAPYGQLRADVCGGPAAGAPNCPGIGFQAVIATRGGVTRPVANGRHTLQFRITEDSGRMTLSPETPLEFTVDNPAAAAPQGVLTTPTNAQKVSGTITISGHAWVPGGRVAQALLVIDGFSRSAVRYGLPRPEACAQLTGIEACPNIGFEATFDTRLLPNGNHVLGIFLAGDGGQTTFIPKVVDEGINIRVEN